MTKNILLAAASVVALGFAGAASAADLSVAITTADGPFTVSSTTAPATRDLYTIAEEVGGELTGEVAITVNYNDPLPTANNLLITYTLGGGATFEEGVVSSDLAGFGEVTISSGGLAGSNTVTFLVSENELTPEGNSVATLTTDITFDAGDAVSVQVNTRTENGTPIEGGNAIPSALVFVDYDSFISVSTDPAEPNPVLDSETNFTTFQAGATTASLGTFTIELDDEVFTNFAGATADEASFEGAEVTLNGSLADLELTVEGADVDGNVISIDETGEYTVTVAIDEDGTPNASAYSLTADIDLAAGLDDQDDVAVGPLASIEREGTSVIVPWVASGSLSAANNTRNVLRISNSGETTGQVYLQVIASAGAQGTAPSATDAVVATGLTVPAGSDLQITSQQMQNFLGDFRRADIRVIVEGEEDDLIFRSRVVQPDGTFEEISLEAEEGPDSAP